MNTFNGEVVPSSRLNSFHATQVVAWQHGSLNMGLDSCRD